MAHIYTPKSPYIGPTIIKGVVFDNDNTLYKEPENAKALHEEAAFYAVQSFLPNIDKAQFLELMEQSRKNYGGSLEIFAKTHNISPAQLRQAHYAWLIQKTDKTGFFKPEEAPLEELEQLKKMAISFVIATHGTPEWTEHTLVENRIKQHFNDSSIITKDDIPVGKNRGPEMYHAALNMLGAPMTHRLENCGAGYAVVEDTVSNLKHAKALGMITFFISSDHNIAPNLPDYVDVITRNTHEAIKCIIQSNQLTCALPNDYVECLSIDNE